MRCALVAPDRDHGRRGRELESREACQAGAELFHGERSLVEAPEELVDVARTGLGERVTWRWAELECGFGAGGPDGQLVAIDEDRELDFGDGLGLGLGLGLGF